MPTLLGLIGSLAAVEAGRVVRQMLVGSTQEPHHRTGTYFDPDRHVYVGWVNDTMVPSQPVRSADDQIALCLTGELLGERAVLGSGAELSRAVETYQRRGDAFVEDLNGTFAGIVIDRSRNRVLLFNDRFGVRRVFFAEGPGGYYFATEAKSLLSVLPDTRQFDPVGLGEFLAAGCTLGERSLFRNISILPGATVIEFAHGVKRARRRYFDPKTWQPEFTEPPTGVDDELVAALAPAVRRIASESSGLSLTGGLDSRMVLSVLSAQRTPVSCYTFGSQYRTTYDVAVSRAVAEATGNSYRVLPLDNAFVRDWPRVFERAVFISDGYIGASGASELYLNRQARDVSTHRLTGNYGSELLRGIRAFKCGPLPRGLLVPEMAVAAGDPQDTFRALADCAPPLFAVFRQAPHQDYGRSAIERSQVLLSTPFLDNDIVSRVMSAPCAAFDGWQLAEKVIHDYAPGLMRIPTDRGYLGRGGPVARAARRAVRQGTFKLEYWANRRMSHRAGVRSPVRFALDRLRLGWHKFDHFGYWLNNELQDYVRANLLDDPNGALGEGFNARRVAQLVGEHFAGRANHTSTLDQLLTLAVTRKSLLRPISHVGAAEAALAVAQS